MRATIFSVAVAGAMALAATADAQAQDRTRAFVDQIALQSDERPMARWDGRICVGAVGLAATEAQLLVDRISARAQSVGLRPGEPGCRANVMVIYAPDSDALTRQIVDQRRDLLGYYSDGSQVTAGRDQLTAFAETPRPIRWWQVSDAGAGVITDRPGAAMDRQSSGRGLAAAGAGDSGAAGGTESSTDIQGMDAVRANGSRMRTEERNDLSYALVVVDARRVASVQPSAWMDYVALVSLAQIDPEANPSEYDSILNLFTAQNSSQSGLSAWDEAYLSALYRARSNVSANRQASDIARRMSDSVGGS
ncbi:MAG: hypothetical protein AB7T59_02520 [Hyphomonadaceae bacterium]